ncbi:hypothetical protein [Allokutzneria oryzae]|uniref:Asp23/Gls24 family envelope stress response protein n=1 Tax=Allokutzneria oryzae TaxID=1378989 RepID=A0ABV6A5B6_9PSEU
MPTTEPADAIAEAVLAHPSVRRLDAGAFGSITSYLPGRRVDGVRAGGPGEPVEIGVVLTLGRPLPEVVADLRERVRRVGGDVPVDVTVADVVTGPDG